nr:MAG TPA: hypothetical protein [Caudoviricetes sp.]
MKLWVISILITTSFFLPPLRRLRFFVAIIFNL